MRYRVCKSSFRAFGVEIRGKETVFAVENHERKPCALLLFPKDGGESVRIPMQEAEGAPGVNMVALEGEPLKECDYLYELNGCTQLDAYATKIVGRETWGDFTREREEIKCGIYYDSFRWGPDRLPYVPKEDMVVYRAHVRGFSMKLRGAVGERGTFRAIERRLPYLQEMGITTLELMPAYEFEECMALDPCQQKKAGKGLAVGGQRPWEMGSQNAGGLKPAKDGRLNYWGYAQGNYFAPKASYLGEGKGCGELKRLIAKLHQKGMECILEFLFDEKLNPHFIIDVLHYWAREYHVDGFHLICGGQIADLVAQDPYLRGRKLFYQWFSDEAVESGRFRMEAFSYNEGFLCGIRRFANHQGGTVKEFTENVHRQHAHQGFVNFLAWNNGFTLMDSLTYTERRNQENGEGNKDGVVWNYSCNCGEEGPSRRKGVMALRERQMRNQLATLMLSQGAPMLWMGDECGNSQQGNNNAYCQDNDVGWKDWGNTKRGKELYRFVCGLAKLRGRYPALRNRAPMRQQDYLRCGYPDLSYHSGSGWQMELEGGDRAIGMLYCSRYADIGERRSETKDIFIYSCYNFSETEQRQALPVLPRGFEWHCVLDTSKEDPFAEELLREEPAQREQRSFAMPSHTVCLLVGRREERK